MRTALGLLYYDIRRFDAAAIQFLSLRKRRLTTKNCVILANALEQKGDWHTAQAEYQKISPAFELYANAQIHAAMIFKKEGRLADAI